MYRAMTAPILETVGEGKIALQSVNVEAEFENLLCQVTMKQSYRNLEKINIEAVYTFPLPLGAVLLDMTIKTPSKELKGLVTEKSEAEDRYEEAITDGDTAIMLEQVEPGLYTMNLGNLQPEDTIDISITYAELFKWQGNSLRFFLPTTVAPRYGDSDILDFQQHQAPEYDLTNENLFSLAISISGVLSRAAVESPSHKIISQSDNGKTVIALKKGQAAMDRDFVLNLSMDTDEKSAAHVVPNGDGYVALASFYPRLPSVPDRTPRCITIIIDCSGSMSGDSIDQAGRALKEILDLLRPEDMFNIVRFGSSYKMLFPSPMPAGAGNLKKAKKVLENLGADMGGTEIGQAVAAAVKGATKNNLSKEALLITDGEVWHWEELTRMVAGSGVRFFTVGVGSSVSEAFVQTLADVTGGACELVSPCEDMAEKIVRHFKRIYYPKATNVKINWPGEPEKTFPKRVNALYDGDTTHVYGWFKDKPEGDVYLRAELENGGTLVQRVPVETMWGSHTSTDLPETIARMAAAFEMRTMEEPGAIAAMGVKYQLMSRYTNYLAIDVKSADEKARDLPALQKTPQMLAAGWGGMGTVVQNNKKYYSLENPMYLRHHMAYSIDNFQPLLVPKITPNTAYKGKIEKLFDEIRNISEQSRIEYKEFLEHLSLKFHQEIAGLQEKMFDLQMDKIFKNIDDTYFKSKEILIEEFENYLRSCINDHLRYVSEILSKEMNEYENVIKRLCYNVVDQFKYLINDAPVSLGSVDFENWVEFGGTLEKHFRLQGGSKKLLSIREIEKFKVPDGIASFLKRLIRGKDTEAEIVCAFLYVLLHHPVESLFSRETKRIIRKQYKVLTPNEKLFITISDQLIPENQI